jgi:uncharacterized protein YndB with AHSA1/START domain
MSSPSTDRIEKQIHLRAPLARVWHALTDSAEFGRWFRAVLDGPFTPGAKVSARLTFPDLAHVRFDLEVVAVEPRSRFAWRWHPYAIDTSVDYSAEPTTLVEFTLADADGGTLLSVVESGFDKLPASRRDLAFRMNDGGWAAQLQNVAGHVSA